MFHLFSFTVSSLQFLPFLLTTPISNFVLNQTLTLIPIQKWEKYFHFFWHLTSSLRYSFRRDDAVIKVNEFGIFIFTHNERVTHLRGAPGNMYVSGWQCCVGLALSRCRWKSENDWLRRQRIQKLSIIRLWLMGSGVYLLNGYKKVTQERISSFLHWYACLSGDILFRVHLRCSGRGAED